ncbi:MAG: sigma-70 family RNA polymerase sigma factor [Deltaproteobacteria bacterium]|nr:sigma-70 family RNA polymerase sigma factor [Deltaproteobacteria bacterium]
MSNFNRPMSKNNPDQIQDWFALDDHILINAHLKGEAKAYEVLYKKHSPDISRLVYSIVKNNTLVEDIVQEVFLLVYRYLPRFRGQSSFKTWVYRIAVNEALRQMKRSRRWVTLPQEEMEALPLPPTLVGVKDGPTPERMVIEGEQKKMVRECMDQLPSAHRVILTLYYLEELPVHEIAEILDIPPGSVKSRLFYARKGLKDTLTPYLETRKPQGSANHGM